MEGLGYMRREQTSFSGVMDTDLNCISKPFQRKLIFLAVGTVVIAGGSHIQQLGIKFGMGIKFDSHLTSRTSLGIGQGYFKDFITREPLPLPSSVALTPSTGVGLEGEGAGK